MLNRHARRAAARNSRTLASKRPVALEPVPRDQWPPEKPGDVPRVAVWVSREYLVQVFIETDIVIGTETIGVGRATVNRLTLDGTGRFDDEITWDQLQRIKADIGFADRYAIEIYPRAVDLVNVANMRHLWLLDRPLPIGWFTEYA